MLAVSFDLHNGVFPVFFGRLVWLSLYSRYQAPYTYGFTVEFEKTEDRDYYTQKDPAHAEFVKSVKENLSGIAVFDYEPGKF